MAQCSYVYPKDTRKNKKGEQCNIFPKEGEYCFKHKKMVNAKKKPTLKKVLPPSLGKRGRTTESVEESNMRGRVLNFTNDDQSKALREYYANKKADAADEDQLTDIEVSSDSEEEPVSQKRKVIMVDDDGDEEEMNSDTYASECEESMFGDHDDPFHPKNIATIGAHCVLDMIETSTNAPGFKQKVIDIPAWNAALDRVLTEQTEQLESIDPKIILVAVPLFMWTQCRFGNNQNNSQIFTNNLQTPPTIQPQTVNKDNGNSEDSSYSESE